MATVKKSILAAASAARAAMANANGSSGGGLAGGGAASSSGGSGGSVGTPGSGGNGGSVGISAMTAALLASRGGRPNSSGMPLRGIAGTESRTNAASGSSGGGQGSAGGSGTRSRNAKAAAGRTREFTDDGADGNVESDAQHDGEPQNTSTYLSPEQVDELDGCDPEEEVSKIAQFLGITNWKEDLQNNILLSTYHSNYYFAKENKFSAVQISSLFLIMKSTLEKSLEKSLTQAQALTEFKRVMFEYSTPPSQYTVSPNPVTISESVNQELFGPAECKLIVDYTVSTLFQHYRLFQYVFNHEQEKQQVDHPVTLELPSAPLPLREAITLEAYEAEQRARQIAERELLDLAALNNAGDILDVLSPEELKQITVDTINELINTISEDVDKMLADQRQRFVSQVSKLPNVKLELEAA